MGWLKSKGIIRVGPTGIADYYINASNVGGSGYGNYDKLLLKVPNSNYSDYFVAEGQIRFKVTSSETGEMTSGIDGDINGYPYFRNSNWNLWRDGSTWILSKLGDGPAFGHAPKSSYIWNNTNREYEYNGDEYYTCNNFKYLALTGSAGTFIKNTDNSDTISLSGVFPDNFIQRTSGTSGSPVGTFGQYEVGFHEWKASYNNTDYYIYKIIQNQFTNIDSFSAITLDDKRLDTRLVGNYHLGLGKPTTSEDGFFFHDDTNLPVPNQNYIFKKAYYTPVDEGEEEVDYDGTIEYSGETLSFTYQGLKESTENEFYNRALIYMADASCWR